MILQVGKVIYSLLTGNAEITKLVGKKIYPLIADFSTTFPFIVYKRDSIDEATSKDRLINKQGATVTVVVASDKYNNSIEVAQTVIDALRNKRGLIAGINVKDISLLGADEDYIDDTYIQRLSFKIEI